MGHSFLNNAPSLEIYITFLVDLHVCGQRNNSMFSKRPREHVVGAPPLSLCVGHFGQLLEDGGSGRKEGGGVNVYRLSCMGFPGSSAGKEPTLSAGDPSLIPGSGRSPGEGNGYPLQYSCLENSMDRGAWWATVHGVAKSWM